MADRIDQFLDQLSPATQAPPPAPTFLRALARRRQQRRLTQAAAALSILLIAGLLLHTPRPHPPRPEPIVAHNNPTPQPLSRPGALTLVSLSRANSGRDVDSLLLPDSSSAGAEGLVPTTLTRDPDLLDQVARQ